MFRKTLTMDELARVNFISVDQSGLREIPFGLHRFCYSTDTPSMRSLAFDRMQFHE